MSQWLRLQAAVFIREGKLEEALDLYSRLVASNAEPDILRLRAITLNRLHRFDDAISDLKKALLINPNHLPSLFDRAVINDNRGQYEEAIADADRLTELFPDNVQYRQLRAQIYLHLNDSFSALKDYDYLVGLLKSKEAYYMRAMAFHGIGEYGNALKDLNYVIELDPKMGLAFGARATAKTMMDDLPGALTDFEKAIDLIPDQAELFNNRGRLLLRMEDSKNALKDQFRAIELNPECALFYSNRAQVYFKLSDYGSCIEDCRRAIELNCESREPYFYLASAFEATGDLHSALSSYNSFVNLVGRSASPDEVPLLEEARRGILRLNG